MGNQQSSRSTTPASPQSQSPGASHGHDRHTAYSTARRESIQALSTAKTVPPTLTTTTANVQPTTLRADMGNSQSDIRHDPHHDTHAPARIPAHDDHTQDDHHTHATHTAQAAQTAHDENSSPVHHDPPSRAETPPQAVQPLASLPVDVPDAVSISSLETPSAAADFVPPVGDFSRPPRLPLPIEEEVHTPGSPIISPADLAPEHDMETLPRRTSMLSSTTVDDDDLGEEFKTPTGRLTVPTRIEWEGVGERVYVTGTFAGWNRKFRLNPDPDKPGVLSAMVPIHPGTHHLMFIVDNDMMTSDRLPTAVDYTNILVNYLEVSYEDVQEPQLATPVQERPAPEGIYPPQLLPPTPPPPPPPEVVEPELRRKYHQSIPRYLLDLDAPEESSRFARANAAAQHLPTPPSLPMFLSKSILNGTTPMKDDSSVLIMPNHTVLNHLATSSIKDGILATSATTRYKQKFLTTIMYKPKEESD